MTATLDSVLNSHALIKSMMFNCRDYLSIKKDNFVTKNRKFDVRKIIKRLQEMLEL